MKRTFISQPEGMASFCSLFIVNYDYQTTNSLGCSAVNINRCTPLRPRSSPNRPDCSRYLLSSQARPDACIPAVHHCQTKGIR